LICSSAVRQKSDKPVTRFWGNWPGSMLLRSAGLFPLVFKKEAHEGAHQALLTFFTHKLNACLLSLDKDTIWRLIHARSLAAQSTGRECLLAPFSAGVERESMGGVGKSL
jgi:hypothetical protein